VKFVVVLITVFFLTGCFEKELSGKVYTIKGDGSIKNAAATQVYIVPYASAEEFLDDAFVALDKIQLAKHCDAYQVNLAVYDKYVEVMNESDIDCSKPKRNFKKEVADLEKKRENLLKQRKDIQEYISLYKSTGNNSKVAEFESNFNELNSLNRSLTWDLRDLVMDEDTTERCDFLKESEWLRDNVSCQSTPRRSELRSKQHDILRLHAWISVYTDMKTTFYPYYLGPTDSNFQSEIMLFALSFAKEKATMRTITDFEGRFRFEDTKTNRAVIVSNYTDSFSNIVWAVEFPTGSAPVELNNRNGLIIKQ
jgi:hypothetical protein